MPDLAFRRPKSPVAVRAVSSWGLPDPSAQANAIAPRGLKYMAGGSGEQHERVAHILPCWKTAALNAITARGE
jgi:hypothetical protein